MGHGGVLEEQYRITREEWGADSALVELEVSLLVRSPSLSTQNLAQRRSDTPECRLFQWTLGS